jgi:hypothetical protein
MAEWAVIDPETGRIHDPNEPGEMPPVPAGDWGELVCFVHMGRSFGSYQGSAEYASPGPYYAELYAGTQYLGRSYTIVDTAHLEALTAAEEALRKTAKTAARIALKEGLAHAAAESTNSGEVGDLARLILFGLLEQPDMRHWATLPRWLQVARVPCPPGLDAVDVVIRYRGGREAARYTITSPPLALNRQTRTLVAFCRHLAEQ